MVITIVMTNITSDNINYELFLSITTDVKYQYIYIYIYHYDLVI